jgi:hypothetical protein
LVRSARSVMSKPTIGDEALTATATLNWALPPAVVIWA